MSGLKQHRATTGARALIWLAVGFLLVRIATHGEFSWGGFSSALGQDAPQEAMIALAGAGSLLFAVRALWMPGDRFDGWSVGWAVVVIIVGGALWLLLHHDSAPFVITLGILGGLFAGYGAVWPGAD